MICANITIQEVMISDAGTGFSNKSRHTIMWVVNINGFKNSNTGNSKVPITVKIITVLITIIIGEILFSAKALSIIAKEVIKSNLLSILFKSHFYSKTS